MKKTPLHRRTGLRPGALSRNHGIARTQFKRDPDAKQLARGSRGGVQ